MWLFYLLLGCALVALLHIGLRAFSNASVATIRRITRYVFIAVCILLALLMLRYGQFILAGILGVAGVAAGLMQRLWPLLPLLRWLWRRRQHSGPRRPARSGSSMTADEARKILGVGPHATAQEIKAAHRALMQKMHPDHGGSEYLASQLNQAKDVLLKSR